MCCQKVVAVWMGMRFSLWGTRRHYSEKYLDGQGNCGNGGIAFLLVYHAHVVTQLVGIAC